MLPKDADSKPASPYKVSWDEAPLEKRVTEASRDPLQTAWDELLSVTREEFADFEPMLQFLDLLQEQVPSQWQATDERVPEFLERLDQLEDLAWAIELKRSSS